jgi:hypothetical protein
VVAAGGLSGGRVFHVPPVERGIGRGSGLTFWVFSWGCGGVGTGVGRVGVLALDLCGGAVQLGEDGPDGSSCGAFGSVEDVDVASGVDCAQGPQDEVRVVAGCPAWHQCQAGGYGLGGHGEFVDAVGDVEAAVDDAGDGFDGGHEREAVVDGDPGLVGEVVDRAGQSASGGVDQRDGVDAVVAAGLGGPGFRPMASKGVRAESLQVESR